ncbi:hypothetical protein M427DRAFT_56747 [Gonapodya prolifera JEL478]|uniref:histidine kinase n=1 Tax=Gonapodya prolifera (strain JEL478) TaxID=1344416 RepID=A0A139AF55_GONPJ|nr:hypothetical protein M427DRAFT_56747 [Gonapodya prolifera JEL478]|eukprot:KXS15388.1 hypothetical protein M427DRAFT_56747 [Gonapodya prolifera JEL478]
MPAPERVDACACGCLPCNASRSRMAARIADLEAELEEIRRGPSPREVIFTVRGPVGDQAPVYPDFKLSTCIVRLETETEIRRLYVSHPLAPSIVEGSVGDLSADSHKLVLSALHEARATGRPCGLQSVVSAQSFVRFDPSNPPEMSVRDIIQQRSSPSRGERQCLHIIEHIGESSEGPLFLIAVYDPVRVYRGQLLRLYETFMDHVPAFLHLAETTEPFDIIWVKDNPYIKSMVGRSGSEFLGQGWRDVRLGEWHAEDLPPPDPATGSMTISYNWQKPDGTPVPVRTTHLPYRDQVTGEDFLLGYSVERELEQRLIDQNRELESASRAKNLLLANVSHELRTPLNGVLGMASLLRDSCGLSKEQEELVDIITQSGNGLRSVINDLLDYSRLEAGKTVLQLDRFSLRELCSSVIAPFRPVVLSKRTTTLTLDISREVPDIFMGDASRLRQVLLNLVGNAMKYTDVGTVFLKVQGVGDIPLENGRLHHDEGSMPIGDVGSTPIGTGTPLLFQVQDTGVGIPKDKQSSLFQPFSQVDSSYKRQYEGTGLGLAIVKSILDLMGGRIWVDSSPGVGSTFSFSIALPTAPLTPSPEPEDPFQHRLQPSRRRRSFELSPTSPLRTYQPRILLAEDNKVNALVVMKFLSKVGLSAETAVDGREAVQKALDAASAGKHFDVILMDIQMPVLDGMEASEAIQRSLSPQQRPFIVALSAAAAPSNVEKCLRIMDLFLAKPVRLEDLVATLETFARMRPTEPRA